jgi:arsenate reductase-like glutaredoxin family protein
VLNKLDENEIKVFISNYSKQNVSKSFLNQLINSIKFYYEEVIAMIRKTKKIKHKCII